MVDGGQWKRMQNNVLYLFVIYILNILFPINLLYNLYILQTFCPSESYRKDIQSTTGELFCWFCFFVSPWRSKLDCILIHWPGRSWRKRSTDPACVLDRGDAAADWSQCRQESWAALRHAKAVGMVQWRLNEKLKIIYWKAPPRDFNDHKDGCYVFV